MSRFNSSSRAGKNNRNNGLLARACLWLGISMDRPPAADWARTWPRRAPGRELESLEERLAPGSVLVGGELGATVLAASNQDATALAGPGLDDPDGNWARRMLVIRDQESTSRPGRDTFLALDRREAPPAPPKPSQDRFSTSSFLLESDLDNELDDLFNESLGNLKESLAGRSGLPSALPRGDGSAADLTSSSAVSLVLPAVSASSGAGFVLADNSDQDVPVSLMVGLSPGASETPAAQVLNVSAPPAVSAVATVTPDASLSNFVFELRPGREDDLRSLTALAGAVGASIRSTDVPGLFEVHGSNLAGLQRAFAAHSAVAYAEVPGVLTVGLAPNDPRYIDGSLWGLNGTYGIKAAQAWDSTTGSTAVTVAVIDTGVDYNHPDLYLNIWLNQGEIPSDIRARLTDIDSDGKITFWDLNDSRNQGAGKITDLNGDGRITAADVLQSRTAGGWADGVSNDGDSYVDDLVGWDWVNNDNNPMDDHSHGTHVAGTIGATANDSRGVAGINWRVQLMPLKFLSSSGSGSTTGGAAAIRYAADHGARVSNNSWSGGGASTLYSAISYANGLNHVVVAAAGNSSQNIDTSPTYPAAYDLANIITVAATDSGGNLASFSNYGSRSVDLGAPGVSIYSTTPNSGYTWMSGTSMATPHVAGVAALVLSQNTSLTAAQVKDRLLSTVTPLSSLSGRTVTGGLLNAEAAVAVGPEVAVSLDGVDIADGTGSVSFGSALVGVPVTRTFTIRNAGTQNLVLSGPINVPSGFTLVSGFGATTLAPGGSTTFSIRFDATAAGSFTGQVSFGTNDSNESTFDFTITATAGSAAIIDDGGTGYSTSGSGWTPWYNQGYQGDVRESTSRSGANTSIWTFSVAPGRYRVSATWTAYVNRATNSPYTVLDGSTSLATVRVNQQLTPNDLNDSGVWWEDLGTFDVTGNTLVVRLGDDANGNVIADAIRIERVG